MEDKILAFCIEYNCLTLASALPLRGSLIRSPQKNKIIPPANKSHRKMQIVKKSQAQINQIKKIQSPKTISQEQSSQSEQQSLASDPKSFLFQLLGSTPNKHQTNTYKKSDSKRTPSKINQSPSYTNSWLRQSQLNTDRGRDMQMSNIFSKSVRKGDAKTGALTQRTKPRNAWEQFYALLNKPLKDQVSFHQQQAQDNGRMAINQSYDIPCLQTNLFSKPSGMKQTNWIHSTVNEKNNNSSSNAMMKGIPAFSKCKVNMNNKWDLQERIGLGGAGYFTRDYYEEDEEWENNQPNRIQQNISSFLPRLDQSNLLSENKSDFCSPIRNNRSNSFLASSPKPPSRSRKKDNRPLYQVKASPKIEQRGTEATITNRNKTQGSTIVSAKEQDCN